MRPTPRKKFRGKMTDRLDFKKSFEKAGRCGILVFADLHATDKPIWDTDELMRLSLKKLSPDLVVLLGDNTGGHWKGVDEAKTYVALKHVTDAISSANVPFAPVFGNHEEDGGVSKEKLLSWYRENPLCLMRKGECATGTGNYALLITDGENPVINLYFIDSGSTAEEGGYAYVSDDQQRWCGEVALRLRSRYGRTVPSLVFQHIPVPEVYNLFEKCTLGGVRGQCSYKGRFKCGPAVTGGTLGEGPCPPDINNGQFKSWKAQGDVKGAFFGHDHKNSYTGVLEGIRLTACVSSGFFSYGNRHGVTYIGITPDGRFDVTSYAYEEITGKKPSDFLASRFGRQRVDRLLGR